MYFVVVLLLGREYVTLPVKYSFDCCSFADWVVMDVVSRKLLKTRQTYFKKLMTLLSVVHLLLPKLCICIVFLLKIVFMLCILYADLVERDIDLPLWNICLFGKIVVMCFWHRDPSYLLGGKNLIHLYSCAQEYNKVVGRPLYGLQLVLSVNDTFY